MNRLFVIGLGTVLGVAAGFSAVGAERVPADFDLNLGLTPDPEKGLELILTEPMGAAVMKASDPKNLWRIWELEERVKAKEADADTLRAMTWRRYGWADRPDPEARWIPLGYTPDTQGNLVTNCFACHGGRVAGTTMPGLGNTHFDLTTLATDVQKLRAIESGRDPAAVKDVKAPFNTPLNHHKGFSNAVIFAHVFSGLRDPAVGMKYMRNPELLKHHDMNAPPWWYFDKKDRLYADAFAPKTPRQLMPFAMSPIYSDERFRSFEPNFVHIQAYEGRGRVREALRVVSRTLRRHAAVSEQGGVAFRSGYGPGPVDGGTPGSARGGQRGVASVLRGVSARP